MPCCEMSKTIIVVRHFGLGGRESLETALTNFHFKTVCAWSLLVIAEVVPARARLQLSGTQLRVLAADSVNTDYKLVDLQFNVFKTTSTGVSVYCFVLKKALMRIYNRIYVVLSIYPRHTSVR